MFNYFKTVKLFILFTSLFFLNIKVKAFIIINDTPKAITLKIFDGNNAERETIILTPLAVANPTINAPTFFKIRYVTQSCVTRHDKVVEIRQELTDYSPEQLASNRTVFTVDFNFGHTIITCNVKCVSQVEDEAHEAIEIAESLDENALTVKKIKRRLVISGALVAGAAITYGILKIMRPTTSKPNSK